MDITDPEAIEVILFPSVMARQGSTMITMI